VSEAFGGRVAEIPHERGPRGLTQNAQALRPRGRPVEPVEGLARDDQVDGVVLQARRLGAPVDAAEARVAGQELLAAVPHRGVRLDADDDVAVLQEWNAGEPGSGAEIGHDPLGAESGDLRDDVHDRSSIGRSMADVVGDPVRESLLGIRGTRHRPLC
jgi:hypothetical protein